MAIADQYIDQMAGLFSIASRSSAPLRLAGQCEVCRQWSSVAVCSDCVARFAAPRERCERCGIAVGAAASACGACLQDPPPFDRTVCVADYGFPWDRLIADFKFQGRVELARVLARLLADAVRRTAARLPDLVLPVPLAVPRLRERGYNQAWVLARAIASELGLRADARLLQCPIATAHQADLGRAQRQRNRRTAFIVDPNRLRAVEGRRLAVVDDVMTTGATVREAAATLLSEGAAAVDVWVLARTPVD
jgi:ComF family protein